MRKLLLLILLFPLFACATAYYISPTGNDGNAGTFASPRLTVNQGWALLSAGDTLYARGGTYTCTSIQRAQGKSGTSGSKLYFLNYPGETPIFDFGTFERSTFGACLVLGGDYLHVKGIKVKNLEQQLGGSVHSGILLDACNYSTVEQCEASYINGWGFMFTGSSSGNLILNCDSHHNSDSLSTPEPYGGSDGFLCSQNGCANNVFRGCRAWLNSDDGFDFYGNDDYNRIDQCWVFLNGRDIYGEIQAGNGSGFKLGPPTNSSPDTMRRITRSLAFDNKLNGFDQNIRSDAYFAQVLYNNVAFRNTNYGFYFNGVDVDHIMYNNASYNNGTNYTLHASVIDSNNTWNTGYDIVESDFLSVDTSGVTGVRQSNGDLPDLNFLKSSPSGDMINQGKDVGIYFYGTAPEIGAFEYIPPRPVKTPGYVQKAKLLKSDGKFIR